MENSAVIVPDGELITDKSKFGNYPSEYEGHFEGVMISYEQICSRTKTIAKAIHQDFHGRRPVLICVLKGASVFFHHLCMELQKLRQGFSIEFIRASSYHGNESTGNVKITGMDISSVRSKDIILVEDIIDTGITLSKMLPMYQEEEPRSLNVCVLLDKRLGPERSLLNQAGKHTAKYTGFSIPDSFIIGFGLDFNERYRDLEDIYVISEEGMNCDFKDS